MTIHTAFSNKTSSREDLLQKSPWNKIPVAEMAQIHSDGIAVLNSPSDVQHRIPEVDAILTTQPNIGLMVRTADCLPILLHHHSGLVGAIHAGRKGTEQQILAKSLKLIKETFGVNNQLHVWFGPAICTQCYQINQETDLHYDLIKNNTQQLYSVFAPEQVELKQENICTLEDSYYYSYRQTGPGVQLNYFAIARTE